MRKARNFIFSIFLSAIPFTVVHAVIIDVSFDADYFMPMPSPQDPVSGTFSYNAASETGPITSLTAFSLPLLGHTYDLNDPMNVGSLRPSGLQKITGGHDDGTPSNPDRQVNFAIEFYPALSEIRRFAYSFQPPRPAASFSSGFVDTTTGIASVPEPATLALMGLGLVGLGFSYRRKTKRLTA